MVFILTSQLYHRISVLVPVLVRVPEYLSTSTSTSTSTVTLELTSTSTVRVPEIKYSSTASTSTEYEYPSPVYKEDIFVWTMTFNSLTENEEHDIPSHIWKTIFWIACLGYFLDPDMWFHVHL